MLILLRASGAVDFDSSSLTLLIDCPETARPLTPERLGLVHPLQNVADPPEPVPGSVLESKSKQFRTSWLLAVATALVFGFTLFHAHEVLISVGPVPRSLTLSPGKTITVVNILSHLIAFLLFQLLDSVLKAFC
jgi:hypothetical protein